MRKLDVRLTVGTLLIVGGIVYLLQNLGIIQWGGLVWAFAAALAGAAFLSMVARDRSRWWAFIPGLALLGVATLLTLEALQPATADQWGGSLLLGSIGLSFWLVYAIDRSLWWAVIPGGVLVSLAVVAGLDNVPGLETGGVFFLGLGFTFLAVALLPTPHGPMRWGFFPAAALLVMGVLLLVGFERSISYIWPAALIVAGLFLLTRALRRPA